MLAVARGARDDDEEDDDEVRRSSHVSRAAQAGCHSGKAGPMSLRRAGPSDLPMFCESRGAIGCHRARHPARPSTARHPRHRAEEEAEEAVVSVRHAAHHATAGLLLGICCYVYGSATSTMSRGMTEPLLPLCGWVQGGTGRRRTTTTRRRRQAGAGTRTTTRTEKVS